MAATLDRVWTWVLDQRQQSFCGDDGQGIGEDWMDDEDDETQRLRSHFSVSSSVVSEEEEAGREEPALAQASFGLDDLVREIEDWQAADALQQRAVEAGIELEELRPSLSAGNEATQRPRTLPSARIRWGTRRNRGAHDGTMLVEPLLVHGPERDPIYEPEPRSAALPDRHRQSQPFVARRVLSLPSISPSTPAAPSLFFAGPPAEPEPITMPSRKYNNDTIAPSSYSPSKLRSRSSDMDLRAAFSNNKRPVLLRGPASSESSTTTTSSSTHSARAHFPLLPHMDSISALLRSRASVAESSRASMLKISAPLTAPATPPKHQQHARAPSGSSESSCDSDSAGVLTPNTSYTNIRAVSASPGQLHGRPAKFNLDRALPPLPPLDATAKRPASQLPPPRPTSTTPYSPAQSKPPPPSPVQRPKRPPLNKRQISLPMSVDIAAAEQILATPPRAAPSPMDYMYPHDDEQLPQSANPYALVEVKRGRRLSDGLVRTLSRSNSGSRPTSPVRSPRRPKGAAPPSAFSNPLVGSLAFGDATRGLKRVLSFSRPRATEPEPEPLSAPSPPAKDPVPTLDCDWDSDSSDFELVTAPRGYFAYSSSSSSASPNPKFKAQKREALLIRAPARAKDISFEAVRQWAAREGEIGRMEAVGRRGVRVVFREPGVCGRWCVRGKGDVFVEGVGNVALEVVRVK